MTVMEGTAPGASFDRPAAYLMGLAQLCMVATAVALWIAAVLAPPPCPTDAGCTPTEWAPLAAGLAMAVPFTILLHPWIAAVLAAGAAAAWWQAERSLAVPLWGLPLALTFLVLTLIVTVLQAIGLHRLKWGDPRGRRRHRRVGKPDHRSRRLGSGLPAAWPFAHSSCCWARAGSRPGRRSPRTPPTTCAPRHKWWEATIIRNDRKEDRFTARLDNGTEVVMRLADSSPYPVESRERFYLSGSRVVALVREPVDHTWWMFWCALLGGLGLMLAARVVRHNLAVRRLFARDQPVRAVQYVEDGAAVHVLLGHYEAGLADARVLRIPVTATMPYRPAIPGVRPVWPVNFPTAADLARARPGELYGHPGHWRWCALVAATRVFVPRAPAELVAWVPGGRKDGATDAAPESSDLDEPVPWAELAEPDRSAARAAVRTHRAGHALPYLFATAAGLGAGAVHGGIARELGVLDRGLALITLWALVGAGIGFVWRRTMVSRAAWNDGGVAVVTKAGVHHLRWPEVEAIEAAPGGVRLRTGDDSFEVYARGSVRWWPVRGERNTAALAAALRDTRQRALATSAAYRSDPPRLVYPTRPMRLWALWLGETAALFALMDPLLR